MPILNFKTDKMFTDISDEVEALIPENFEGLVNCWNFIFFLKMNHIRKSNPNKNQQ